jgi:hypothetical protein
MKTIVIKTQSELDALPDKFEEYTQIEIRSDASVEIVVRKSYDSSTVYAYDSSTVTAYGSSTVYAYDSSTVTAYGSSRVYASDSSTVYAYGSSTVTAYGSSTVYASDSSRVYAYDSSTVTAYDSSTVTAYGSSTVYASDSSRVYAYGSSRVTASDFSMIAVLATSVVIKKLLDYSVASLRGVKVKIEKKDKTATVIKTPKEMKHTKKSFADRCESDKKGHVILFKSVNPETGCDYQTGKIKYEGVVECPDWDSDPERQCGGGLHLSPTPGAALSYHQGKLLKCRVALKDLVVFASDVTKVRCKRVEVLGAV